MSANDVSPRSFGNVCASKKRPKRRARQIDLVVVPADLTLRQNSDVATGVVFHVGDVKDFGVLARQVLGTHVYLEVAEALAERDKVAFIHLQSVEDQHLIAVPCCL